MRKLNGLEQLEARELLAGIGPEVPADYYPRPLPADQAAAVLGKLVVPLAPCADFVPHYEFEQLLPPGLDETAAEQLRELHRLVLRMDGDGSRLWRGLECVDNYGRDLTGEEKGPELGLGGFCGAWTEELAGAVQDLPIWGNDDFQIEVVTLNLRPPWRIWGVHWRPFNCHNALRVTYTGGRHPLVLYFDNGYLGDDLQAFNYNQFTRPWFDNVQPQTQDIPQQEMHT